MKILRLTGSPLRLELHPDSALLPDGRPLFYPDFGSDWRADLYLAVRIGRLGKRIALKFAPRYYDAISLALIISPSDMGGTADSSLTPYPGWLNALDSSITHGRWIAPGEVSATTVSVVRANGEPGSTAELRLPTADIDPVINRLSLHTTLRTGDLILIPLGASVGLSPKSRITATDDLLNVKVV